MDPAQQLELKVLQLQKPMNDVIDLGNSPVQQFYNGSTVFLTGGSGFMGKHLLEKLFRSCAIQKMFLLLRSKKGKSIQERLQYLLKDPVYDMLRAKQPQFADRIVPVEGDVADVRLGLSVENWITITHEVDVVFHAAATVRFDEPLQVATMTNVRGTREVLALARQCPQLKSFVHLSTAFTTTTKETIGKTLYEEFYPSPPVAPETLIALVEELEETRLNGITNDFIDGWPNTYTFTKAVAEELIRTNSKDLPICIVRPPGVVPAYYEPSPGWLDMSAVSGASGIIVGVILGILHAFYVSKTSQLPGTPVDYVNNAVIAAGWDAKQRRDAGDTNIPIYTVSHKDKYISIDFLVTVLRASTRFSTQRAVYMCGLVVCGSYQLYFLLSWLFHYIPAYIADAICTITGKRPAVIKSFIDIYTKIDKMDKLYIYFLCNYWDFRNDNIKAMLGRMSQADRAIYNCDISTIDMTEYIRVWIIGIRKFIIKDGLKDSIAAYKKQRIYQIINYFIILPLYTYALYSIMLFSFSCGKYAFHYCF